MKFNVNREQMENILRLHEKYIIDKLVDTTDVGRYRLEGLIEDATAKMWEDFEEEDRKFIARVALGSAGYVEDVCND